MVSMTLSEVVACYHLGASRLTASAARSLNHAKSVARPIRQRMDDEAIGVLGERALAKFLGQYQVDGINTFHAVGDQGGYEVRATALRDGKLIVRDDDKGDRVFVLALVGLDARVVLAGWLYGWQAQRDEWRANPRESRLSWFVPQEALRSMDTLPRKP